MTGNTIDVQTTTIDEFCEEHKVMIDFIKIDIQGSEAKVFEGMKKSVELNSNLQIITEFYPNAIIDVGSSPENFLNALEQSHFVIKEIEERKSVQLKTLNKQKLIKKKNESTQLYCFRK